MCTGRMNLWVWPCTWFLGAAVTAVRWAFSSPEQWPMATAMEAGFLGSGAWPKCLDQSERMNPLRWTAGIYTPRNHCLSTKILKLTKMSHIKLAVFKWFIFDSALKGTAVLHCFIQWTTVLPLLPTNQPTKATKSWLTAGECRPWHPK